MSIPVSPERAHSGAARSEPDSILQATRAREAATFARRRLRLGITGVGGSVVLSAVWLTVLWTGTVPVLADFRLTPGSLSPAGDAALLVMAVFAVHTLLLSAVEYAGGAVVVRAQPTFVQWFSAWARGVMVQAVLLGALTFVAALAASSFGTAGVLGVVVLGALGMLALQGVLARATGRLTVRDADSALEAQSHRHGIRGFTVRVVDAHDEAFVGGWIGLTNPQLWIPRRWTQRAHAQLLAVQLARRHTQLAGGTRRRALWGAVLWPALGIALAALVLPWSFSHSAMWLALPAAATLWSFVAVLLLPSVSRPAVYHADAAAARTFGPEPVVAAIRQLDAWQDDEPERSPGVERIFHPVPSRGNRERALMCALRPAPRGAHQLTRLTLFTSLAGFGLLGRVVHCNIGRPELWTVYPGD